MLIDNPGMREIQMWTDEDTLRQSFADVAALTADCRFADCRHRVKARNLADRIQLERDERGEV